MSRIVKVGWFAAQEAAEKDLLLDVRRRQEARHTFRQQLLIRGDERVSVRGVIHALEPDVERELREGLAALEDRIAVLRHAPVEIETLVGQRSSLVGYLAENTLTLDTTVGRPLTATPDVSLADVPWTIIEQADHHFATLREALVEAVDNVIAAELLVAAVGHDGGVPVFQLVEHDADSVAQVKAFAADVQMIGQAAAHLGERLHLAALRRTTTSPRDWLLGASIRRREARNALDRSRAVHAALAEVIKAAELTE